MWLPARTLLVPHRDEVGRMTSWLEGLPLPAYLALIGVLLASPVIVFQTVRARRGGDLMALADATAEPPAPGAGLPPGPQTAPTPPARPPLVPGLQPAELAYLTRLLAQRPGPQAAGNGRELADTLRRKIPYLTDLDLARAAMAIHTEAFCYGAVYPPGLAMRAFTDALAAAADDMTQLARLETT
jgi:hypothetical protein